MIFTVSFETHTRIIAKKQKKNGRTNIRRTAFKAIR